MNEIEVLIALVAVALVLVRFADAVAIPYPIVLVIGGLAIGLLPIGPELELDPDVVFLVFLPPLLQSAAYWTSPRELRAELAPLAGLVIGLSLGTMVIVALIAYLVIPDLDLGPAFVLGAIVSPTDPVAAVATLSRLQVSERISTLVEGEAMLNDATALVAYKVAVAAVVSGGLALSEAAAELLVGVAGGIAVGLAIAWAVTYALRRLDDAPLSILLSVLMAYVAFASAEEIGASGVLAVVSAGLYTGWRSHEIYDADRRLNAAGFWQVLVFTLNTIIFMLLGLQFPGIVEAVAEQFSAAQILGYGLLVAAVVIVARLAWQFLPEAIARLYQPAGELSTGADWRERVVVGWSGMRGAVSLAAALAIPLELDSGQPFTDRDLVIYLTVAVIAATLVLQGLTLPGLVSRLGLSRPRLFPPDEAVARLTAAQAALDRLDQLEQGGDPVPEVAIDRLREMYQARFARCVASLQGDARALSEENPFSGYRELRGDLIKLERETLLQMRNENRLRVDVLRRIERELDLDEARLLS